MAAVINTNIASLNAQRNLTMSQTSLATALQRLSSGLRINSAKDDAAGLAISDRFTTQIRGLNQSIRNANDGISLAQTGEGALAEVTNNLQRIRELAVQASNASNSAGDRAAINLEVQQRLEEIDRTASQTSFNGTKLLDGSFGGASFQVGANAGETIAIETGDQNDMRLSGMGSVARTTSAVLGDAATSGSISITTSQINFGTVGNADGSLDIAASRRLFGDSGQVTLVGPTPTDFTANAYDGSNTQAVPASLDFSGANLAQFNVTDGTDTASITLNQTYASAAALAADIEAQLQLGGGDLATSTVDTTTQAGFLTFTNVGNTAALQLTNVDANATAAGFAASAGAAGAASGASFEVDGIAISLTTDLSASLAALGGEIQTQLNAASAGTYTVSVSGADLVITNNNAGTSSVDITNADLGAIGADIVNTAGSSAANSNTDANFTVGNGTDTTAITLDDNYADFDAVAAAIQTQLDADNDAAEYTVTNDNGNIKIVDSTGAAVSITGADANAAAAGFGNVAGAVGTSATFSVDGTAVTLNSNYADMDAVATAIQGQLSGYTVTAGGGAISIVNDTPGSAAVAITAPDANADSAGYTAAVGTAGTSGGTITLADFSINGTDLSGSYADTAALVKAVNSSVSGVYASVATGGALKLSSANDIALAGADATGSMGFAATSVTADQGSLSGTNTLTVDGALDLIQRVDSALGAVSTFRSTFGAVQNRFESVIANLTSTSENLTAARSRIQDADFAAETAVLTRAQILQQAGTAMLAQANSVPNTVLSLLRG